MALKWRSALLFSLLFAGGTGYYYFALFLPHARSLLAAHQADAGYSFGTDFYPIWLTSGDCLLQRRNPYSPEVTREIQAGLFGRVLSQARPGDPSPDYRAFSYPAFVDFFGLTVAWLSFPTARIVLAILLPCLIAASVALWSKAVHWPARAPLLIIFTLLTISSYPGLEGLFAEQFGLIVGFLLAGAAVAVASNRLALAGTLLALATAKPQMSALVIFYFLLWALANWRERQRLFMGLAVTLSALTFSAMIFWPSWIAEWLRVLWNYRNYSRPPLPGYLFGRMPGMLLIGLALAGSIGYAWRMRRAPPASPRFAFTIGLLLTVTTVTLLPEHAVYDHVILLPGIMLILGSWDQLWRPSALMRCMQVLAAGTLFWPWMAAIFVIVVHIVSPALASAILFLPLRTAAAIPFVVLALLLLVAIKMRPQSV